jgi:peptidoglycan/xylan/chitin deacetylase (PgdA/CDA1 family)
MFRYTLPLWITAFFPSLTWKVKTRERKVYLTFDDGPHPGITPWVLEQLSSYNARATFFCIGDNVRKFRSVYEDVVNAGHGTGNHTYRHLNGWKTPLEEYVSDTETCSELVKSDLFRPPYGRITRRQIKALKTKYRIIMWSVLTRDYDRALETKDALKRIKASIEPGCIIVLHDSEKAEAKLKELLPEILRFCSENQFTFEALG